MRKIYLISVATCCLFVTAKAQLFQNIIGQATPVERCNTLAVGVDTTFLLGGDYKNNSTSITSFAAMIKVSKTGNLQFAKQFNITNSGTAAATVVSNEAIRNNAGNANGHVSLINKGASMYLVRTGNTGNVIWARKFTGTSPKGVVVRAFYNGNVLGGFYVILRGGLANSGSALLKLNATGITLFQTNMVPTSSISNINFFDMQVTSDGGCIVTGEVVDIFTGDPILVKFNSAGSVSFARGYEFDGTFRFAEGLSVAITPTGYAVGGRTDVNSLTVNNLVFTTNTSGIVLWAKSFNSFAISSMRTDNIIADGSGNIIFAGNGFNSAIPAYQVKLNSAGVVQHANRYYTAAAIADLKLSPQGYVMAGTSDFQTAAEDFYILQTNTSGLSGTGCPRSTLSIFVENLDTTLFLLSHTINSSSQQNVSVSASTPTIPTTESRCGTLTSVIAADLPKPDMQIYALPGQETVSIQVKGVEYASGRYSIAVYGPNGRLHTVKNIQSHSTNIVIPNYVSGLYSFVLMQTQQKILTEKIIL